MLKMQSIYSSRTVQFAHFAPFSVPAG